MKAAQKFFSEDKDRSFEAKVCIALATPRLTSVPLPLSNVSLSVQMMDESVRLLTFQQQLEKEADGKIAFFGLSVNETIRACLVNGMSKRADKLKSDFKVPDKRSVYPLCALSPTSLYHPRNSG